MTTQNLDYKDIIGNDEAIDKLKVAAVGGHNVMLIGSSGTAKGLLAARLPSILPPLTDEQLAQTNEMFSLCNMPTKEDRTPYLGSPHHTVTVPAIIGGGSRLLPGSVSRAHNGVLFLDEAPEFSPRVLQCLREPLELGEVKLRQAGGDKEKCYPAKFQLIIGVKPCPCGMYGNKIHNNKCSCSPNARMRYYQRIPAPILDRIDIKINVSSTPRDVSIAPYPKSSTQICNEVIAAREIMQDFLKDAPWESYSEVSGSWLRSKTSQNIINALHQAVSDSSLSLRGADRVLRVAYSVAALDGRTNLTL